MNHMVSALQTDPYSPINSPEYDWTVAWVMPDPERNGCLVGLNWKRSGGMQGYKYYPEPSLPDEIYLDDILGFVQDPLFYRSLSRAIDELLY